MILLGILTVLSGPLMAWALQTAPLSEGGKLAAEWITPAILCGILLKLLWDERTGARLDRERFESMRNEHERENKELLRQNIGVLERVAEKLDDNASALKDVREVVKNCTARQRQGN